MKVASNLRMMPSQLPEGNVRQKVINEEEKAAPEKNGERGRKHYAPL